MAQKITQKQLLQAITERYEELFFQNTALRTVLTIKLGNDLTWVKQYLTLCTDAELRQENRARFDALRARISAATADSDLSELLAQIPEAPKVG